MEIDRDLAPWAMVDHVTTHGDRGTTTAPEAKPGKFLQQKSNTREQHTIVWQ